MKIEGIKYYIKGIYSLGKGFWSIRQRPKICFVMGAIISFTIISVYLTVLLNEWYGHFWDIIQRYEYDEFWPQVGYFSLLAMGYISLGVYGVYLKQMVQIEWRQWMTEHHLTNWLDKKAYYKLKLVYGDVDNPDQRIAEDIYEYIVLTLSLTLGLVDQILTLIAFVVVLWNLSGVLIIPLAGEQYHLYGYMVWLSLIYSLGGTYLVHKVGKKLIGLNYQQQAKEADFRFAMMRLRENSDCIAFYGGEQPEYKNFRAKFTDLVINFRSIMKREKILNGFTVGYGQMAIIIPILFVAPKWFNEQALVGWIMQVLNAFGQVQGAMSYLVNSYTDVARWCSVVHRLYDFQTQVEKVKTVESQVNYSVGQDLSLEGVSINLPNGEMLAKDVSFSMAKIKSLLIAAPSGRGKSTMLKVMANLWPYAKGKVIMPKDEDILFLPQRPYLPMGTLAKALAYPNLASLYTKEELSKYLELVELGKLIPLLDTVEDWSKILSLGEQQRLAFIRIFLYKPAYVFLDEATSALDEGLAKKMYSMLAELLPKTKIISVAHNKYLTSHHDYKLSLGDNYQWTIKAIEK